MECLECGTDTITAHVVGCNTGAGMYQIVKGDAVIGHAFNEHGTPSRSASDTSRGLCLVSGERCANR